MWIAAGITHQAGNSGGERDLQSSGRVLALEDEVGGACHGAHATGKYIVPLQAHARDQGKSTSRCTRFNTRVLRCNGVIARVKQQKTWSVCDQLLVILQQHSLWRAWERGSDMPGQRDPRCRTVKNWSAPCRTVLSSSGRFGEPGPVAAALTARQRRRGVTLAAFELCRTTFLARTGETWPTTDCTLTAIVTDTEMQMV